jgi:hypothetical protein
MLLTLLGFIRSPIGKYAAIALACIALIFTFALHERHAQYAKDQIHERKAVAAVQADLDTCHANDQALEASLAAQNSAVDRLKAEGDARVAASAKAVSSARAVAESYRQNAASILKARPGADKCASADALIAEAVR